MTEQATTRDKARYVITKAVWRLDHDVSINDSAQAADAIMDALDFYGLVIVAHEEVTEWQRPERTCERS